MTGPWIAALMALFVWWFSTGAILCLVRCADGRGPRATGRVREAVAVRDATTGTAYAELDRAAARPPSA